MKEKLEKNGQSPEHFKVVTYELFLKGFKHDDLVNYEFTKGKLADLDIAEKNLNRDIDSAPQLEMFLGVAKDVKKAFEKHFGADMWSL